jgi:hypothetical protein
MTLTLEPSTEALLHDCVARTQSRVDLWVEFLRAAQLGRMLELGVYQGDFAAVLLERCPSIDKYYMLDPWRHLDDWNKPANEADPIFEGFHQAAKRKTDFAADRRIILRGKTTDVIDEIRDGELDFAYIDGDHTLKGIAIDLVRVYPKVKLGGFIGGDDFTPTIWQHHTSFEPTLVCPFVAYFAEAVGATLFALPNSQFCMQKTEKGQFTFVDLAGQYDDLTLRSQLAPGHVLKIWFSERFPKLMRVLGRSKRLILSS